MIYTFDTKNLLLNDTNGYPDFNQVTVITDENYIIGALMVDKSLEMRIDLISQLLYGSTIYIEELCALNNIINPLNIKEGDVVYYFTDTDAINFYIQPVNQSKIDKVKLLLNKNKDTKQDVFRPSINSNGLQQVQVDDNSGMVKFISSF